MKTLFLSLLAVPFIVSCSSAAKRAQEVCEYYGYKAGDAGYQRCVNFETTHPTNIKIQ